MVWLKFQTEAPLKSRFFLVPTGAQKLYLRKALIDLNSMRYHRPNSDRALQSYSMFRLCGQTPEGRLVGSPNLMELFDSSIY